MTPATLPTTIPGTPLSFSLQLEADSDTALLRALTLLHRRRCRVTSAEYSVGTSGFDRLLVKVEAPPRMADRVGHWLAALVEVRTVETETPADRSVDLGQGRLQRQADQRDSLQVVV